jgi:hypothetical protein
MPLVVSKAPGPNELLEAAAAVDEAGELVGLGKVGVFMRAKETFLKNTFAHCDRIAR